MDDYRARPRRITTLLGIALLLALSVAASPAAAATPEPASPWHHVDATGAPAVDLWFGWSSTCPHCTKARAWLSEFAPTAPWLEVHSL
jgi:hypothetical protein